MSYDVTLHNILLQLYRLSYLSALFHCLMTSSEPSAPISLGFKSVYLTD